MPLYAYQCEICDVQTEQFNKIAERHTECPKCPSCGRQTELVLTSVQLAPVLGGGDWPGYQCIVSDEFVSTRKRRREIMAEHDLIEKS